MEPARVSLGRPAAVGGLVLPPQVTGDEDGVWSERRPAGPGKRGQAGSPFTCVGRGVSDWTTLGGLGWRRRPAARALVMHWVESLFRSGAFIGPFGGAAVPEQRGPALVAPRRSPNPTEFPPCGRSAGTDTDPPNSSHPPPRGLVLHSRRYALRSSLRSWCARRSTTLLGPRFARATALVQLEP